MMKGCLGTWLRRSTAVGIAIGLAGVVLTSAPRASAQSGYLFDNWNGAAVQNNPSQQTVFTLTQRAQVTTLATYHWNYGRGARPGTITLINQATGSQWGPYGTGGQAGQGGVQNAAWVATIGGLVLPAGTYIVRDSDPATWSQNVLSGSRGFVRVTGMYQPATATPVPWRTASPTPSSPAGVNSMVIQGALSTCAGTGCRTLQPLYGATVVAKINGKVCGTSSVSGGPLPAGYPGMGPGPWFVLMISAEDVVPGCGRINVNPSNPNTLSDIRFEVNGQQVCMPDGTARAAYKFYPRQMRTAYLIANRGGCVVAP